MMVETIQMINTTHVILYLLCFSPGIMLLAAPMIIMYKLQDKGKT